MSNAYRIPPKQVPYHGIKFRSKNEAKWAVIWDVLGIRWEYEPERYVGLDDIDYDPDFFLPDFNVYGEAKGTNEQLFESQERISAAIDYQATPVGESRGLLLLGPPPYSNIQTSGYALRGHYLFWHKGVNLGDFYIFTSPRYYDLPLVLDESFVNEEYGDFYLEHPIPKESSIDCHLIPFQESTSTKLHQALSYARSARFDFDDNIPKMISEGRTIIGGT